MLLLFCHWELSQKYRGDSVRLLPGILKKTKARNYNFKLYISYYHVMDDMYGSRGCSIMNEGYAFVRSSIHMEQVHNVRALL